jgi:predicted ester cyclase
MSTQDNKAIVRRWNEELWTGNQAIFEECLAPNCLFHRTGSQEELKKNVNEFRQAFPDAHGTIEDLIAEGDKVVTRWTVHGTHQGALWGAAPTGKQVTYTGMTINRMAEGKIVEDWYEGDVLGLLHQIGALAPVGQTSSFPLSASRYGR